MIDITDNYIQLSLQLPSKKTVSEQKKKATKTAPLNTNKNSIDLAKLWIYKKVN